MWHPQLRPLRPRSRRYVYTSVHDGLRCLQPMWIQCLGFTRQLSATYCAHLVLISTVTFSSPNVPFNFLHRFGFICRFTPVGLSTTSCLYVVSISEFLLRRPCASQQLPACIWFQYRLPVSQQLLALIWFEYLTFPPVPLIKLL